MTESEVDITNKALEKRVEHVESVVDRLENGFSDLRTSVAGVAAELSTLVKSVGQMTEVLNRPKDTNYTGVISAVVSAVLLLGAIGFSNILPVQQSVSSLAEVTTLVIQKMGEESEEQSEIKGLQNREIERVNHLEERIDSGRDIAVQNSAKIDMILLELTERSRGR